MQTTQPGETLSLRRSVRKQRQLILSEPTSGEGVRAAPRLHAEVESRFGVLPNFFRLAPESPEITANLWGFARFAYLDNPLPSLFKERLFVYLSRFCEARYCIVRHVGFLLGLGRPSGDQQSPLQTIEQVIRLIRLPLRRGEDLQLYLSQCAICNVPLAELPDPDTAMEQVIFACATHAFLQTPDAPRCLNTLKLVLGESRFEHLMVFLGFVRTAHYWTKVHTELVFEEDVKELLATQEKLAECLLNDAEAGTCEISQKLIDERESPRESKKQHDELLRAHQLARDSEERLRHGNAELAERVAELQMASSELQDSLRAAQNLMEDALQARQLAETLNDELRKENSERKRAEEAIWQSEERLRLLNANLEDVVLERTAELRRTIAERERLQEQLLQAQKMESVGTLASGVAHDFNNLLNIITSYAAIMRRDGKNPATVSEGAAIIEETVRRGATLVHQLMTLGRKGEAEFVSVEIDNVAEKLVGLLTETFPKTLVITLELERGLPSIRANENQLHQTLLNLCVNARDAMPEGGRIALKSQTISGAELRRRMPEADTSRYLSISVSDTGMGMDEATRRRIFEPFFTTKPAGQGTGLGLAVVYGIVKNHGGFIEVKSEVGRGTTFCIYLPIPEKVATEISETTASEIATKPAGRGETVLFVDDEEQQLKVMQRFLESEGYKVLGARDGREAVETFKRHKDEIAIAVLDLGLPKLGGWQAFQEMREVRPELKVLVASGFVSSELEVEIAQGKLGEIIEKPYRLDDVLKKISQAIHGG